MWLAWSCPNCSNDITLYENVTNIDTVADIFTGLMESNCTKPCNTTKAKTRFIFFQKYFFVRLNILRYLRLVHEVQSPGGGSVVEIIPDSTVLVTITQPVSPSASILMSGENHFRLSSHLYTPSRAGRSPGPVAGCGHHAAGPDVH